MKPQKETKLAGTICGVAGLSLLVCTAIVLWGGESNHSKERSEALHNVLLSVAVAVGGGWVVFQFTIKRSYETALDIGFSTTSAPHGKGKFLVLIDCIFKNPGARKLGAKAKKYVGGKSLPIFKDEPPSSGPPLEQPEQMQHSVNLQIKRLHSEIPPDTFIDWYATGNDVVAENLLYEDDKENEINLIESYEIPGNEEVHFWMEPGETYHLGTPIEMAEGLYMAMITFVGSDGDQEFWRRIFCFSVPPSEIKGAGDEPTPPPKPPPVGGSPQGKHGD